MNVRTKTQFKLWQRLPELGAAGPRPVPGRSGSMQCQPADFSVLPNSTARSGRGPSAPRNDGARAKVEIHFHDT